MMGKFSGYLVILLLCGVMGQAQIVLPKITLPSLGLVPRVTKMSDKGFGDRMNAYAWGVAVFKDDLYVGTGRHPGLSAVMDLVKSQMPVGSGNLVFPDLPTTPTIPDWFNVQTSAVYSPQKFDIWSGCAASEIWRFDHESRRWSIVWKSPYVPSFLQIPGANGQYYSVPASMGIRKMEVFDDGKGHEALFAFNGIGAPSSGAMNPYSTPSAFAQPDKAPLAYWSKDGITWDLVPTPLPDMGLETRASTVYQHKLYVGVVNARNGKAAIWRLCTAGPTDTGGWDWEIIDTSRIPVFSMDTAEERLNTNTGFVCLKEFNGKLYAGTQDFINGYELWCGTENIDGTWNWEQVIDNGNSFWAGTMEVFKGALYMGSVGVQQSSSGMFEGFNLIRINTNNKPQLIIGGPLLPTSGGVRPLSGLPSGCANPFNFYCWSLKEYKGKFYLGTFDMVVMLKQLQTAMGGQLPEEMSMLETLMAISIPGADLWVSDNGTKWTPVTLNGFGNQFNYGVRNMVVFEDNLVCATANPFYGCEVLTLKR